MNQTECAIHAQGLSKKFGLTLHQAMKYGLRDIGSKLFRGQSNTEKLRAGEFWAVDDVSFDLHSGEALGIMGVNGCGKTTLLRILNGVYAPDAGRVEMRGRVGALIAAGAGFAPMLSGRENVYVNGTLLGLSTKEITNLMDEIVAFSELDQFIDLPVKNYSSGMYVRLGFAVAALSSPDVLLMDEILAVGDLNFQKKCFDHILKLKRQGTAIILVSHSPGAVWSVCDRGLFMDKGKVIVDGPVEDIIRAYDDQNSRNAIASSTQFDQAVAAHGKVVLQNEMEAEYGHSKGGTGEVICTSVRLLNGCINGCNNEFGFNESFLIEADIEVGQPLENLLIRFTIDAVHYRYISVIDSYEQGLLLPLVGAGCYRIKVSVNAPNLRPGAYTVNVGINRRNIGVHLFYWFGAARFIVTQPQESFLYAENNAVMHFDCDFQLTPVECKSSLSNIEM